GDYWPGLAFTRAAARSAERAIRTARGAGATRLVRLVLVESRLLSALGAAGGVLIALWAQGVLMRGLSANIPLVAGARIDWGVLAFTNAISMTAACLCALS